MWHGIKGAKWARQCLGCQRAKIHRHTRPQLEKLPVPEGRFRHVHVDLVGPLPPSDGHTYLLTAVDRFSRWPEAFPLRSIDAPTVAQAFTLGWVARFGIPDILISDRGPQFVSSLWGEMARTLGTSLHHTTSYHPQSNGMVEHLHRQLNAALTARLRDATWIRQLPWVLLGIRAATKEDLDCSPAELVYGHQLRLPGTTAGGRPVPRSVRIRPGTQGGNGEPPTLPHGTSSTCGASPPLHSGRVAAVPHGVDKTRRTPPTSYPELRWPLRSPRERPQSVLTTPGRQGRLRGHRSPEAGQHP